MYRVKNNLPGTLSVTLEEGMVNLEVGGSFDLESGSSRKWINACLRDVNSELSCYLVKGCLSLIHDSEQVLGKDPIIVKSHELEKRIAKAKNPKAKPHPKASPQAAMAAILEEIIPAGVKIVHAEASIEEKKAEVKAPVIILPVVEPVVEEEAVVPVEEEKPRWGRRGKKSNKVEPKKGVPTFTPGDFEST